MRREEDEHLPVVPRPVLTVVIAALLALAVLAVATATHAGPDKPRPRPDVSWTLYPMPLICWTDEEQARRCLADA